MMFTYSRCPKKSGISSYRILTTLDGGCTSSIVPTELAQEWGVDIDRRRNDITLLMADGSKMAVDGIAYIFCKPDGCNFYKQIRFIVSPEATEVLISFRDQQELNVLPKNYLCYLGEENEQANYLSDVIEPSEDSYVIKDYDPHVEVARRIVGAILENQADSIIPSNYCERSQAQDLLNSEEKCIKSKTEFEQRMIGKHRSVFSSAMNKDRILTGEEMSIKLR